MGQNDIDDHEVGTITNEVDTIIKEVDNDKDKEEEEENEDNDDKEEEEGQKDARRAKGGPKGLRLEVGARRTPKLLVDYKIRFEVCI